ncbi:MAG: pheromone autoinducer 2 transporter [Synergistetes bacterium ADurb.Bin520]|nr:MAG: pheromone autoinducer 2 transporter [Synergistetes bacterium ADurb.Bin520]
MPPSQVSPKTIWTVALHLLLIGGIIAVVYRTGDVMAWIVLSAFLAVALNAGVLGLERRGLRRRWAIGVVFILAGSAIAVAVSTIIPLVVSQIAALVRVAPDAIAKLENLAAVQALEEEYHVFAQLRGWASQNAPHLAQAAVSVVTGALSGVLSLGMVLVLTVFMLLCGNEFTEDLLAFVAERRRAGVRSALRTMQTTVSAYVAGTVFIALVGGGVIGTALLLAGSPYYLALGFCTALLGLLPYLGPVLAAVLVVSTTFSTLGSWPAAALLGVFLIYGAIESNVLQPVVQSRSIRMNPLLVFLVMLVGTSLAGMMGALLALPVAGATQAFVKQVLLRENPMEDDASA